MTDSARTIVFDLDGTLVDSVPIIAGILDAMLIERGSPRRVTAQDVRPFASLGGPGLLRGVLAEECGDLRHEVDDFRARYRLHPTPAEALYPGVAEGVAYLAGRGFRLAICSNKPQPLCEKVIADVGLGRHFQAIVGHSPDRRMKPAPDLMEQVLTQLGAAADDCIYVGDSEIDQALAKAMNLRFAFVTYGYATEQFAAGEQQEFERFPDLVRWIEAERAACPPARAAA